MKKKIEKLIEVMKDDRSFTIASISIDLISFDYYFHITGWFKGNYFCIYFYDKKGKFTIDYAETCKNVYEIESYIIHFMDSVDVPKTPTT